MNLVGKLRSVLVATTVVLTATSLQAPPVSAGPLVADVAAGIAHTCVLTKAGGVRCWGATFLGQLGNGVVGDEDDEASLFSLSPVKVSGLASGVASISSAGHFTCALLTTGTVRCWGANESGQLGDGTTTVRSTPVAVTGLSGVTSIATGTHHACAVLTTGGVRCWGANGSGQLGDGTFTTSPTPVAVTGLTDAASVSAGRPHTCAVLTTGGVRCWGANGSGQLGDGTFTTSPTPVAVTGLTDAASVSAGDSHTCAVSAGGAATCWGGDGFLGDGTVAGSPTPVGVSGLATGVASLSAAGLHTCALTIRKGVRCWGANDSGELGDGTSQFRTAPVNVTSHLGPVTAIDAGHPIDPFGITGGGHTCAVTPDGSARCWGYNGFGQLGDRSRSMRREPVAVVGLGPAKPPKIAHLRPASTSVGATVTIKGKHLADAMDVRFNGVPAASFTVKGTKAKSRILAVVPPGATTGKVTVVAPGGVAQSKKKLSIV